MAIAGRSLPSPLEGPGQGAFGRTPPPRGRRATYPGAAVTAGPRRAATCPQPTAPAFAARGPAQPSLLGAGLRAGTRPPSSWEPRRAAPARRAPGRSVTCGTRAGPRAQGPEDWPAGQRSRTRLRETPQAPEARTSRARLGILFMVPPPFPGRFPGSPTTDTDAPPSLRPREPNAAGDLRRRSAKARPLKRSPARERAGSARITGAPWWRAGNCTQSREPGLSPPSWGACPIQALPLC